MNLSDVLKQETKAKIIWYLREDPKKYSDIMRYLQERDSGKVNYHLKILISSGLVKKEDESYSLTKKGLRNALYVDSIQLKERYPIPIVVVAAMKGNKVLLAKRSREPFKGLWGLPGNEILYGESPEESAVKEMKIEINHSITDAKVYGSYPTIYRENEETIVHIIIIAVRASCNDLPDEGPAKGKISEYKFFTKKEMAKLKIVPTNIGPASDAFLDEKTVRVQSL